ncbi:major capsid protein [Rhizobium leguminosarum]|uniref:major capsid protein n=1 Tax=Rhizobium leguminosarum TaxID=384 RepID=UPI001C94184D|nr:major capsid protein [Rhizobium leguminosarum]
MEVLNILNPGNELFTKAALTGWVNKQPFVPEYLAKWLPWNVEGETLRQLIIEFNEGSLALIPEAKPGSPGYSPDDDDRTAVSVAVPHFPMRKTLLATEFEGVRAIGSDLLETVEDKRNKVLAILNRYNRAIWEVARMGAISGLVIGHNGQVRHNWFNTFKDVDGQNLQQTVKTIDFNSGNTKLRSELIDARDLSEEKLGDLSATGYVAICGKNRFKSITDHPSFEKMFERYNDGQYLRDNLGIDGFQVASDITVVKYGRSKIGNITVIGDDDMFLCPRAEGMYQGRMAPGTGMADLGTTGLPEYVSSKILDHDEGIEMKGQTNPLFWVERLEAIVKIEQE